MHPFIVELEIRYPGVYTKAVLGIRIFYERYRYSRPFKIPDAVKLTIIISNLTIKRGEAYIFFGHNLIANYENKDCKP